MRDHDVSRTTGERSRPRRQSAGPTNPARPGGLSDLQAGAGNAAVVRMLRRAGHFGAQGGNAQDGNGGPPTSEVPRIQRSSVHEVVGSPGRPLDAATRADMESRLGADFSDVRVHDGPAARASASGLGARAYTTGHHVVIGEGGADRHTLAHELTHVIQQRTGPVGGTDQESGLRLSDPSDRFEREAEDNARRAMARRVSDGQPFEPASCPDGRARGQVQRAPSDSPPAMDVDEDYDEEFLTEFIRAERLAEIAKMSRAERRGKFLGELRKSFRDGGWRIVQKAGAEFSARKDEKKVEPHSHERQPEVEGLRWVSTVTKRYLAGKNFNAVEVQAAIGRDGKLIVAANDRNSNGHLRWLMAEGGVQDLIGYMLEQQGPVVSRPGSDEEKVRTDRAKRHVGAAKEMHRQGKAGAAHRHEGISSAIARGIVIPPLTGDGIHAEMRILEYNNKETPPYLAGTKRPCATCFEALYPGGSGADLDEETSVRPGEFYSSEEANSHVPEYKDTIRATPEERAHQLFDRINAAVPRTYTSARNGTSIRGLGSDSE
jgi:hypothetical protein